MERITLIGHEYIEGIESNVAKLLTLQGKSVRIIEMYPFANAKIYPHLLAVLNFLSGNFLVKKILENRVKRLLAKSDSDLVVFFTQAADFFSDSVINHARQNAKFVVGWILDSPINLRRSSFILADYNCIFISDRGFLRNLEGYTLSKLFPLSEGYDEVEISETPFLNSNKIVFIGSLYPTRIIQLVHLLDAGFEIDVYTSNSADLAELRSKFPATLRIFGPVFNEERSRIFRDALCVLNLQHPSSIDILNYRIFEVLASGGVIATNGGAEVRKMFSSGGGIVFDNDDELISSLRILLSEASYRKEHRIAAIKIAKENTLSFRFQQLVDILNGLDSQADNF